jgi:hypothetical protein
MLHMFCNCFFKCFQVFFKCFRCMFQVFHLSSNHVADVSSGCFKSKSGVTHVAMDPPAAATYCNCVGSRGGARRGSAGAWEMECRHGCPNILALVLPFVLTLVGHICRKLIYQSHIYHFFLLLIAP